MNQRELPGGQQDLASSENVNTASARSASYKTKEELEAQKNGTPLPYFRLNDGLCKRFLQIAAEPREFEGLKLLFPFVREMSVMGLARTKAKLGTWMHLAFMAGHDLGRAHPDCLEDVLPGFELKEAARRVGVLRQCSAEAQLSFEGLRRACVHIARVQWVEVAENQLEPVLLEAVLKTLRTGFAAATVAQSDPTHCEFVCDLPERIGDGINDILSRLLVSAPRCAIGKPLMELLEHPLLRLAREYYPGKRVELQTTLGFLQRWLQDLGVKSEDECPVSELDLADWVTAALRYGQLLTAKHPEVIAEIFRGYEHNDLQDTLTMVRGLVTKAGGTDPLQLIPVLQRWQRSAFGWIEPECYGEELARVVYFSDYAIWISLAMDRATS